MTLGERIKACRQQAGIFGTTVDLLMPEQEAETTEQVLPIQFSEPKTILTIAILIAILFFLCWNAGQNVGEDIGKFIYNLTH